jgi:hypothetical protein
VEWELFTLLAFLNSFLRWMWSRTCSDDDFIRIAGSLAVLLAEEMPNEKTRLTTQPRKQPNRYSGGPRGTSVNLSPIIRQIRAFSVITFTSFSHFLSHFLSFHSE